MKKENILGIPMFLENQGTFSPKTEKPVPGEYATKILTEG